MNEYLRQLKYWWHCNTSGLEELVEDARDLHISELFSSKNYKNLHKERILAPIFEKDQLGLEICSFETASRVLSVYFGEDISQRALVAMAWWNGLCSKNGAAQLRNWCKVAQKYGVVLEKDFPSDDSLKWDDYVNVDLDKIYDMASKNKIGSYFRVDTVDEYLECIDKGYAVALGQEWRSVYNQGGGFKAPWIITLAMQKLGFVVGGHATAGLGYSFLKDTKGLAVKKNSYSDKWGDNGFLYEELEALQKDIDRYGAYAITPIPYTPKDIKVGLLTEQLNKIRKLINGMLEREHFYSVAKSLIGQNLAKGQELLGCAITMSAIWNKAFPNKEKLFFKGTGDWWNWMKKSKEWEEILAPEPYCVIVSPTQIIPSTSPLKNGHIGVIGKNKSPDGSLYIMSNNSLEGKLDTHWTVKTWDDYYRKFGKIPTFYFRKIIS